MEPSRPLGLCLPYRNLAPRLHQPRLDNSTERHQLPWRRLSPHVLFHHNRLPRLAAALRRTLATTPLDARQIWACDQYRCAMLFNTVVVLRVLASCETRDRIHNELVEHYVRRDYYVCFGMVCREGEKCLFWACCRCKARSVDVTRLVMEFAVDIQ